LGLAGHNSASYSLLAQPVSKTLHFVLESAFNKTRHNLHLQIVRPTGQLSKGRTV
jgi:hypothetical protein